VEMSYHSIFVNSLHIICRCKSKIQQGIYMWTSQLATELQGATGEEMWLLENGDRDEQNMLNSLSTVFSRN
jgi:hypothetical protein